MVRRHCASTVDGFYDSAAVALSDKDKSRLRYACDAVSAALLGETKPKPPTKRADDRQLDMFAPKSEALEPTLEVIEVEADALDESEPE